jgi:SIR2-like domain
MTITWDEALVDELCGRRVILFLGAGATMSCARTSATGSVDSTPSWPQLLQLLSAASRCSADDLKHVENLSEKERYLDAAQIIRTNLTNQEYGRILTNEFKNLETKGLHDAVLKLDQRIVMTTNYDSAYEDLCMRGAGRDGYSVLNYYDSGLANRLRSPTRLILKLHGSVKHPEQTVLTRSEYFQAKSDNPRFFALVQSLFATYTLVFIGYSLSDPDIQLLLETSNVGGSHSFRHYAVVPSGIHQAVGRAMSEAYGINLVEYDASSGHQVVADSLLELADVVEAERPMRV